MSKPTKRVTKTIKIGFQMTEDRATRFERMLKMFLLATRLQSYPNELLNESKGDFLEIIGGQNNA